jgi:hypothetical protein
MEQKKLKYLQPNNGTWFYRRSVPTELLEHPYWEGKKFWSTSMNLSTDAPQDAVNDAWNSCNSQFNDIVETIRDRNIHVLNEIDLERRATSLLKMYHLKPGDGDPSFQDVDKYGVKANNHVHFVDAVADNVPPFQDLMEWSKREGYKNLGSPFPQMKSLPNCKLLNVLGYYSPILLQRLSLFSLVSFGRCMNARSNSTCMIAITSTSECDGNASTRWLVMM